MLVSCQRRDRGGTARPVRMMKGRACALVLIIQSEDNTASLAAACAKYYSDSDGYHTLLRNKVQALQTCSLSMFSLPHFTAKSHC